MVKLTVESVDNLNYESERLTFKYNDTVMFRLSSHKLNRGGKGLELINNKNELIISCGRWGKSFHKRVVKELSNLGFETSEKEIWDAVDKKYKENVSQHDANLQFEIQKYFKELKDLEATKIKLQNKIKANKQQLIVK